MMAENLGMRQICAELVSRVLTDEQKDKRVKNGEELLDSIHDHSNFPENVTNRDESSIFECD